MATTRVFQLLNQLVTYLELAGVTKRGDLRFTWGQTRGVDRLLVAVHTSGIDLRAEWDSRGFGWECTVVNSGVVQHPVSRWETIYDVVDWFQRHSNPRIVVGIDPAKEGGVAVMLDYSMIRAAGSALHIQQPGGVNIPPTPPIGVLGRVSPLVAAALANEELPDVPLCERGFGV